MTVAELKEEADSRNLDYAHDAKKDELIALLKKDDKNGAKGKSVPAPEQEVVEDVPPPDPYEGFADPVIDGTKPIIDQVTPSNQVLVTVLDGSNVRAMPDDGKDYDHLVFVQSGRGQEFLISEAAKRKFGQDRDGQIFYNQHGVAKEFKPVDIVALGT